MREKNPLVSIICGYYNRKENLVNSIQSVLDQSYGNFEVIVFDDCSNDGTRELLETFNDSRLVLLKHEMNIGFTKGIIHAISHAKGEYIAIHGAGDISLRERIEKQVELLELDNSIGIVGCLIEESSKEGTRITTPFRNGRSDYFTHGEVMYRRNLYYMAGGYNPLLKYGQFSPLKAEILKLSKAGYVDEVLYKRIHFDNGVSKNNSKRIEQEIFYTWGTMASDKGVLGVNLSDIVTDISLRRIALLKPGSQDEKNFILHARSRFVLILYYLYKRKILPGTVLSKYGSFIRKD